MQGPVLEKMNGGTAPPKHEQGRCVTPDYTTLCIAGRKGRRSWFAPRRESITLKFLSYFILFLFVSQLSYFILFLNVSHDFFASLLSPELFYYGYFELQGLGKLAEKFPNIACTSVYCLRDFLVTPSRILLTLRQQCGYADRDVMQRLKITGMVLFLQ
jgi:hypothetical protein